MRTSQVQLAFFEWVYVGKGVVNQVCCETHIGCIDWRIPIDYTWMRR